jgi:hypothetical protein
MKLLKRVCRVTAIFACVMISLGTFPTFHSHADVNGLEVNGRYVKHTLSSTQRLEDLGVADINGDGWLDIYSTNHHSRPSVLVNQNGSQFTEDVLSLNLGASRNYTGEEPTVNDVQPITERPGLYLYWHLGHLIVRAYGIPESMPVSGTILVRRTEIPEGDGPVLATEGPVDKAVHAEFPKELLPDGWQVDDNKKVIRFTAAGNAILTIRSFFNADYGPLIRVADALPLDKIFVGTNYANPDSHIFAISAHDRHAMAWFDVDSDPAVDVVAADGGRRGQLRGRVEQGKGSFQVLLQRGGKFEEAFPYRELSSYGCPTRQVSLADYDADRDLDIYVVCGRTQEMDQFFERAADGTYQEVSAALGIDIKGAGWAVWLDADGDGDLDLFRTAEREAWLYRNVSGRFEAELIGTLRDTARQVSKADYDGDGDVDLYLAARHGSSLLIGERGSFEITEPEHIGLPRDAACGNWVDYNNDGLQDLHVMPGGIFEHRADRTFYPTGLLKSAEMPRSVFCTWFDSNNDGHRDLLIAIPREPSLIEKIRTKLARWIGKDRQVWISDNPYLYFLQGVTMGHPFFKPDIWDLTLYQAIEDDRHWLEVDLAGPQGNRPAIGASVRVRTSSGTQVQTVGHAEGSLRSSGHYRVYFGLDHAASIRSVEVTWPDGTLQEIEGVSPDRLLAIQSPDL